MKKLISCKYHEDPQTVELRRMNWPKMPVVIIDNLCVAFCDSLQFFVRTVLPSLRRFDLAL